MEELEFLTALEYVENPTPAYTRNMHVSNEATGELERLTILEFFDNVGIGINASKVELKRQASLTRAASDVAGECALTFDSDPTQAFGFRQDDTNKDLILDRRLGGMWYETFSIDHISGDFDFKGNDLNEVDTIASTGVFALDATTGLDFRVNGTLEMSIEPGLVEVQNDLEVIGTSNLTGKTLMPYSSGIKGNDTGDDNTAYSAFYESDGTTEQGYVGFASTANSHISLYNRTLNGNLLLGTNSTARVIINSLGAVTVNNLGTGTLYSNSGTLTNTNPSDERLKNIYGDYERGLEDLLKFNAISYKYEWDEEGNPIRSGYRANEVQQFAPELVGTFMHKQADGKEVERLGFVDVVPNPMVVNSIKEINDRLTALEAA
ncbi:tail fiber domain-containing protein [Reichenbachiella sp.]|uniref:tail fiber domain-containing protein n=1 Tax=Reichenbachiella sp. TaxID=2184521 RepID=UPI003B5B1CFA